MQDFSHTWPYDWMQGDLFFQECPFCREPSVLITTNKEKMTLAKEGFKTHIVMPCCHEKITILSIDDDYIWADQPLRLEKKRL